MSKTDTKKGTIIAVWHSADKGKTESIRAFANLLIDRNRFPDLQPIRPNPDFVPPTGDFILVVRVRGIVIGVTSQGDPHTGLEGRLRNLINEHSCTIVLCSTRTRGETVNAVGTVAGENQYDIIWTSTYQIDGEDNQRIANNLKGAHILELIETLNLL